MHTLGTRLLLLSNDRVPPKVVERMLETVFHSRLVQASHPTLDRSTLRLPGRLPPHPGKVKYVERELPILTNASIDKISNTLSILGALLGGGLFLWQWRKQRTQAQRDEVFGSYMLKVAGVERRAAELELADTLQLDPLILLQRELLTLKTEALDRFATGDIGGQAALADLLAPMNTARDHIGELILHVRESIEGEAAAEGRTPQALWSEAVKKSEEHGEST